MNTAGATPEKTADALEFLGIRCVLSLHPQGEPLRGQYRIEYHHVPISDGKVLDPRLPALTELIVSRVRADVPVLVTCRAGRNRSGLLVALAVRQLLDVTGVEALEYLRAKRPSAVANPAFEAYLLGLQRPEYLVE